eukprot:11009143-Alexandrium_andersonii.AAC.1
MSASLVGSEMCIRARLRRTRADLAARGLPRLLTSRAASARSLVGARVRGGSSRASAGAHAALAA